MCVRACARAYVPFLPWLVSSGPGQMGGQGKKRNKIVMIYSNWVSIFALFPRLAPTVRPTYQEHCGVGEGGGGIQGRWVLTGGSGGGGSSGYQTLFSLKPYRASHPPFPAVTLVRLGIATIR